MIVIAEGNECNGDLSPVIAGSRRTILDATISAFQLNALCPEPRMPSAPRGTIHG
jgi:hypothetical protein